MGKHWNKKGNERKTRVVESTAGRETHTITLSSPIFLLRGLFFHVESRGCFLSLSLYFTGEKNHLSGSRDDSACFTLGTFVRLGNDETIYCDGNEVTS